MTWHTCERVVLLVAATLTLQTTAATAQFVERPYNLELRIECPRQDILLGDEIPIVFTVVNRDTKPFTGTRYRNHSLWLVREYRLTARKPDGRPIPNAGVDELPIAGGSSGEPALVKAGESFQQTIYLNRWGLIRKPGRYTVTGIYSYAASATGAGPDARNSPAKEVRVRSRPIEIDVRARSRQQMGEYIEQLSTRLQSLMDSQEIHSHEEREHLAARLAYTSDERIIPAMLDLLYDESHHDNADLEALAAFCCYLPRSDDVRTVVLNAIRTRGLIYSMGIVMKRLGVSDADAAEVIRPALASKDRETVGAALAVLQEYPADEHVPKLIEIAMDPNSILPRGSVWTLAMHRTDAGVAVLRTLLNDPDPNTRAMTAKCIHAGYIAHPHYPERIDEAYTATLVSVAFDPNHQHRYNVLREIIRTRTREGVKAVQMLLADPNAPVVLAETDPGVRVIRDLLRHTDPDVREIARYHVKWACYESPGRALRLDDLPSEFHEDLEARKKRILEQWLKAE